MSIFCVSRDPNPSNGILGNPPTSHHHGNPPTSHHHGIPPGGHGNGAQRYVAPPGGYNGLAPNQIYRGPPPIHNTALRAWGPQGGATRAQGPPPGGASSNPRAPVGGASSKVEITQWGGAAAANGVNTTDRTTKGGKQKSGTRGARALSL